MNEKRILRALGEVADRYILEAEPMKTGRKTGLRKWAVIAACFALAAAVGLGAFRLPGTKTDLAVLENGESITFGKAETIGASQPDLNVTVRALRESENRALFGVLPITANAYFDPERHNMIGFEGKMEDVKLIVSAPGINLLDVMIEGCEYTSAVGGTFVTAGYFITNADGLGAKTAIYYASFDIGGNSVYAECSGAESEREAIKNKLGHAIWMLIENGAFDFSQILE